MFKKIPLKTTTYRVSSSKIPPEFDGWRIGMLSDLHNCSIGTDNQILLDAVRAEHPDILLLAGDMITEEKRRRGTVHQDRAAKLLEAMAQIAPVYYGMGNHEQRWKEIPRENSDREAFESWCERLRQWGVTLLDNQSVYLCRGDARIRITGLALPNRFFSKKKLIRLKAQEIRELVGRSDSVHFQVLLAHTPQFFKAYMKWGADMALAGHYHGGVVRLPWLGGVISTNFRLFPKYDYGKIEENGPCMIVSSGVGCHTIPIRLNNPPEFVVIELKGES